MTGPHAPGPIVVFGSVNMDLITTAPHLPAAGETVSGTGFAALPGGKGGNQAVAAARAGAQVAFIGAVGDDGFGDQLRAALDAAGVAVERLRRTPGPSGLAAITVDESGENTIVVVAGANGTVTGLTDADRECVRGAGMLVCQLEIPLPAVVSAAGVAAAAAVPVLLNPSPAVGLPDDLLSSVTLLVVNEGEAAAIGAEALERVPHVVTTLGSAGARYRGPDDAFDVPAPAVQTVDTTGAGDAFTGALAVAWTRGDPPRSCLRQACAAGALATTVPGAGGCAPTGVEIGQLVELTYGGQN